MELNEEYVQEVAAVVASRALLRNRPAELLYEPGNGTSYELVLTPVAEILAVAAWTNIGCRSIAEERPTLDDPDEWWILLSWLGHGAWPFSLARLPHPVYLREKLDCSPADAAALMVLLVAVAQRLALRPVVV